MTEFQMFVTEVLSELESAVYSLNFTTGGLGIVVYILQALALYTIAKRRGIKKPWLAWIPLVNVWILGSISDQYQYVVKKQVKNRRKSLLGLNIAIAVMVSVIVAAVVWLLVDLLFFAMDLSAGYPGDIIDLLAHGLESNIGVLIIMAVLLLPMCVLTIIQAVIFYMSMYDLYRSCDPKNSTLFLVLSLVGNVVVEGAYSIFLMLCKDKDLGMPPRKPEPEVIPARPTEQDPWEN